jgi:hypothetical protein
VDQPGGVGGDQAVAGGDEEVEDLAPGARLSLQPGVQGAAAEELHGQEDLLVDDADVVDADDVGVGQPGHRLGLAHQARGREGVGLGAVGVEDLERDLPVQLRIVRAVDDAHGPGADLVEDDVAAELLTRLQIARGVLCFPHRGHLA